MVWSAPFYEGMMSYEVRKWPFGADMDIYSVDVRSRAAAEWSALLHGTISMQLIIIKALLVGVGVLLVLAVRIVCKTWLEMDADSRIRYR